MSADAQVDRYCLAMLETAEAMEAPEVTVLAWPGMQGYDLACSIGWGAGSRQNLTVRGSVIANRDDPEEFLCGEIEEMVRRWRGR